MGLVFDSGMRRFPPRLPEQPIFYPVLNRRYAEEIARGWNVRDEPHAGYVLRFEVPDDYAARFDVQTVGRSVDQELWIPAEQLEEFNHQLVGDIVPEVAFFGPEFRGDIPAGFGLAGKDATAQIRAMTATLDSSRMDFALEISANARSVFLNYPFWKSAGASRLGIEAADLDRCLAAIRAAWTMSLRSAPLIEEAVAS